MLEKRPKTTRRPSQGRGRSNGFESGAAGRHPALLPELLVEVRDNDLGDRGYESRQGLDGTLGHAVRLEPTPSVS